MLGEAALTAARRRALLRGLSRTPSPRSASAVGRARTRSPAPGISVKLSALHPRYELAQRERVMAELVPRLARWRSTRQATPASASPSTRRRPTGSICRSTSSKRSPPIRARRLGRLRPRGPGLSEARAAADRLAGRHRASATAAGSWCGWSRAPIGTARSSARQERGLAGYPVFTRKANTDVSYLACARKLLGRCRKPSIRSSPPTTPIPWRRSWRWPATRPRFRVPAPARHGRGAVRAGRRAGASGIACRVYAPVGSHEDLLAYLVRRLLENGANTSFVNRIVDEKAAGRGDRRRSGGRGAPARRAKPHPRIPLPARHLSAPERRNSRGIDLADRDAAAAARPRR